MSKADKFDTGKPMMSLVDPLFFETVAKVLTFGAEKYGAHNWRDGLETSRLLDATYRHLNAYNRGENNDPESHLPHLGHAACCIMMALRFTGTDLDNRVNM